MVHVSDNHLFTNETMRKRSLSCVSPATAQHKVKAATPPTLAEKTLRRSCLHTFSQLNALPLQTMAPRSLLRHIFRHGPRRSAQTTEHPGAHGSESKPTPIKQPTSPLKHVLTEDDVPESPLAYKSRPDSRQSSILEDIEEEESSNAELETAAEIDRASITETLAALDLDISAFTTRDLILSTVDEARLAVRSHLDTINTTMTLLDALDGFSATIAVLSDEMVEKKRVCEEKLGVLEHVEWAVGQMRFGEE
jgi:hypothetical protein